MQYWNGGKNTPYHKWYHNLKRLYCYIAGHNRFSIPLYTNENDYHYIEHCRRCEIVIVDGDERRHTPSLNLWARWMMVRIKVISIFRKHNIDLMRVLFPLKKG